MNAGCVSSGVRRVVEYIVEILDFNALNKKLFVAKNGVTYFFRQVTAFQITHRAEKARILPVFLAKKTQRWRNYPKLIEKAI